MSGPRGRVDAKGAQFIIWHAEEARQEAADQGAGRAGDGHRGLFELHPSRGVGLRAAFLDPFGRRGACINPHFGNRHRPGFGLSLAHPLGLSPSGRRVFVFTRGKPAYQQASRPLLIRETAICTPFSSFPACFSLVQPQRFRGAYPGWGDDDGKSYTTRLQQVNCIIRNCFTSDLDHIACLLTMLLKFRLSAGTMKATKDVLEALRLKTTARCASRGETQTSWQSAGSSAITCAVCSICSNEKPLESWLLKRSLWWRWGRVELPVQTNPSKNVLQA